MEPYLKWAGGKRTIAATMQQIFIESNSTRLVEPFCGALSIALGVNSKNSLLSDNNKHLINLHKQIQKNGKFVSIPRTNNKKFFLDIRDKFNNLTLSGKFNSRRSAAYFYYMNRTAFNGLCRFNKKDLFNVGWGAYRKPLIINDFSEYTKMFKGWVFKYQTFQSCLTQVIESDFVFIDPPYDETFTGYCATGFNFPEHIELAVLVSKLKAKCIITNSKTDRLIKLYKELGFVVAEHQMPRKIACNGKRVPAIELIAFHNCTEKMIQIAAANLTNFKLI